MIGEVLTIEFEKRITPHQVRPKCYECTYTKVFTTMWWESGFDAGKLVWAVSFFSLSLPPYSFFFLLFFTFAVRLSTSSLTFINSSLRSWPRTPMKFKRFQLTNHSRCLLSFVPLPYLPSLSAAVSHPNFISLGMNGISSTRIAQTPFPLLPTP